MLNIVERSSNLFARLKLDDGQVVEIEGDEAEEPEQWAFVS